MLLLTTSWNKSIRKGILLKVVDRTPFYFSEVILIVCLSKCFKLIFSYKVFSIQIQIHGRITTREDRKISTREDSPSLNSSFPHLAIIK